MHQIPPEAAADLIIGAAGLSSRLSKWRSYHILAGHIEPPPTDKSPLMDRLQMAIAEHLAETYNAPLYRDVTNIRFAGLLDLAPIIRLGATGPLDMPADTPVLIETPTRAAYDFAWTSGHDATVPFYLRARAQLAMAATQTTETLIWLVTDMGSLDQFHRVTLDDRLVGRLEAGITALVEQVQNQELPDPEADDIEDAIRLLDGRANNLRQVAQDEPIMTTIQDYQATVRARLNLDGESKQLKTRENTLKTEILAALLVTPQLELPTGETVESKVVHTAARSQQASSWVRLDIKRPTKAAA